MFESVPRMAHGGAQGEVVSVGLCLLEVATSSIARDFGLRDACLAVGLMELP